VGVYLSCDLSSLGWLNGYPIFYAFKYQNAIQIDTFEYQKDIQISDKTFQKKRCNPMITKENPVQK
jgi:hypothetical protein